MRPPRPPARRPRAGFTLIELLVVISIMALLSALVAAGIGKVRNAQMSNATDMTLTKLQQALNAQWEEAAKAARDLRDNVPTDLVTICGGDKERARSVYAYMRLKQQLPQTFAEAQANVTVTGDDGSGNTLSYSLPKLKTYATVPAGGGGLTADQQAAVLLFMALANKGTLPEEVTQGAQTQIGTFTAFRDAWGTPISFVRFFGSDPVVAEIQAPPYAKVGSVTRDPFDPAPAPNMGKGRLEANIPPLWATNKPTVLNGLNANLPAVADSPWRVAFDGGNKVVTVISAGADKTFQNNPGDSDDSYGFRVLRQGNKGE